MEELSSVCLPEDMKQGTYYQQSDNIVLMAENLAQEEHAPMIIRFSKSKIEHRAAPEKLPLMPLTDLKLSFKLIGGVRRIKLERYALIDAYKDPFLLLVDGVPHILLAGTYGGPDRPENRDRMHRRALNLKSLAVERVLPDQMFLVFENVVMNGHIRDGDVELSEQMVDLKLGTDDWNRCA